MRQRGEPSRALLRLAVAQADVVTREQALGLDLSRHTLARLVDQGLWQRLTAGVFLTHGGGTSWDSLAWAGILVGGESARLGGTAAAYAGGLFDEPPGCVHVLVRDPVRVRGPWAFVRERPGARSPRTCGTPPRTMPADTVLDLCHGASPRTIEDLVTRAVQRRLLRPEHLVRALRGRSRYPRRGLLLELLSDVAAGAESSLELRYLRDVERPHGLPPGERQLSSTDGSALRDVIYRAYGVVVELDGRKGHEGEGRFRDMRRDNKALLERLETLRYGFGDVAGEPCSVAWEVGCLLRRWGWTDPFRTCSRCPSTSSAF